MNDKKICQCVQLSRQFSIFILKVKRCKKIDIVFLGNPQFGGIYKASQDSIMFPFIFALKIFHLTIISFHDYFSVAQRVAL